MSGLVQPWLIHDADLSLWPAWKDGLPMRSPDGGANGRRWPEPLLQCKASLNIQEVWERGGLGGLDWRGVAEGTGKSYTISVDFPDGVVADELGRVSSRLSAGGMYVLVVRFARDDQWTVLRFFYVVPESDGITESGQVMMRSLRLAAGWMQEDIGSGVYPDMEPVVYGEVDWVCGSRCVTAMRFNPLTEVWTSLQENDTGDGTRFVNISPVNEQEGSDVFLSMYLPRAVEVVPTDGKLKRIDIVWSNSLVFVVGRWGEVGHGLRFQPGYSLQEGNYVEPIVMLPQARMLDEPMAVFRYLGRVYATLGHGVFAVPGLLEGVSEARHDPPFRIAPTGANNPATGGSGLTLTPDKAWLDGLIIS